MSARVGEDGQVYDWQEDWAELPAPETASAGWAHHGLAVTRSGEVVGFHTDRPEVVIFDSEGRFLRSWAVELKEGHGLTLVEEGGEEYLWVADPGSKMRKAASGAYEADLAAEQGQVVKFDMDGSEVARLARPPHPAYESGRYAPTSVAVDEVRNGGSGDIWVADGYGQSLVHRYRRDGTYLSSLDGGEGAGRFNCPHAVFIDRRHAERVLLVADRGNGRIQVYRTDGPFLRVVGEPFLNSPSAFASNGGNLVVAELRARLAILGPDDQLICYLGENGEVCQQPGWPNGVDHLEHPVRAPDLRPGRFNSPHGLAADADGNLYVAEWLIGGRMVKLAPVPA
ncbi:MAG: hypothetical protein ACLQVK_23825 [Acidimicrobiales bacterium]